MLLKEVKQNLLKPVIYDNSSYILTECILWLDKREKKFKYSCTLLANNSTTRAPIEKVEAVQ